MKLKSKCIAFAHYGTSLDVSGVTSWVQRIVPWLADERGQVDLFLKHFDSAASTSYEQSSVYQALYSCEHVAIEGKNRSEIRYSCEAAIATIRFLNRSKPKCFLPQCLPSFHYAAAYAAAQGLPWIFTIHSDDPAYWTLAKQCGPSAGQGVWVAVSESIAVQARMRFPNADVRVIPYGVPPVDDHEGRGEGGRKRSHERFRVVYSGRLIEDQKRVSLVVDAMILACKDECAIEAVFIGEGPERADLERKVREAGLGDRITFTGRLTPEAVQQELVCAHAILLMSDFEGLPVALLEAMSVGVVPVVRYIPSGVPELVANEETGVLVDADPQNAAKALIELSRTKDRWMRLSANCRKLITERFSQAECHKKWRELIDSLSERCAVQYPLVVPRVFPLPEFDPSLGRLDVRKPSLRNRMLAKVRRIAQRLQRN